MDRRRFIARAVAAGVIGSGLAGPIAGCATVPYVGYKRQMNTLVVRKADLGESGHALLENPQIPRAIYLRRTAEGDFLALLLRCTHQGCEPAPASGRLECPCHGSQYSLSGDVLRGPAQRSLYRYDVTADAEHVYIKLPDPSTI
jgi:Rieske Fe-S protein